MKQFSQNVNIKTFVPDMKILCTVDQDIVQFKATRPLSHRRMMMMIWFFYMHVPSSSWLKIRTIINRLCWNKPAHTFTLYTVQIALKFIRNLRIRNTRIWHTGQNTHHQYSFAVNTQHKILSAFYQTRIDTWLIMRYIAQHFHGYV